MLKFDQSIEHIVDSLINNKELTLLAKDSSKEK